jgi:hypothetical protein
MTTLPATWVEAEAVDAIAHWIDLVAELMTVEASRLIMRKEIRDRLREGTIPVMQVIEAAEHGHQDADFALRELAVETIDRGQPLPTAIGAYVQKALLRPPVTYPPGRNFVDTWVRDAGVALLVKLAVERWNVPATRGHLSQNSEKRLSACYLVSVALGRRGYNLRERSVEKIHSDRRRIAERLSATIPPI